MTSNRINLITLAAKDVAALTDFYCSLGWEVSEQTPQVSFFDMGALKFGIYDRAALAKDLDRAPESLGNGAMTLAQNFADRAGVDAAYALAVEKGATVCKAPEEVFWGGYSGTWADPEGHIWEYAHNPFWTLDEDGWIA